MSWIKIVVAHIVINRGRIKKNLKKELNIKNAHNITNGSVLLYISYSLKDLNQLKIVKNIKSYTIKSITLSLSFRLLSTL